jgi:hypothetical protein
VLVDPENAARMQALFGKLMSYAPSFTGPVPPEQSVSEIMSLVYGASLEKGNGGSFVSHLGTKRWL